MYFVSLKLTECPVYLCHLAWGGSIVPPRTYTCKTRHTGHSVSFSCDTKYINPVQLQYPDGETTIQKLVITIQFKIELSEVQLYLYYHTCSPPTLTHTHTYCRTSTCVYTGDISILRRKSTLTHLASFLSAFSRWCGFHHNLACDL